jgi:hypothetical protein
MRTAQKGRPEAGWVQKENPDRTAIAASVVVQRRSNGQVVNAVEIDVGEQRRCGRTRRRCRAPTPVKLPLVSLILTKERTVPGVCAAAKVAKESGETSLLSPRRVTTNVASWRARQAASLCRRKRALFVICGQECVAPLQRGAGRGNRRKTPKGKNSHSHEQQEGRRKGSIYRSKKGKPAAK